jgi:hypothetical protein
VVKIAGENRFDLGPDRTDEPARKSKSTTPQDGLAHRWPLPGGPVLASGSSSETERPSKYIIMSRHWAAGQFCVLIALAAAITAGPAFAEYLYEPLNIKDGGARWHESSAWGGGAATTLNMPDGDQSRRSRFDFLGGAAPQLVVGCTSPVSGKGHWRLRAGFTPPGSTVGRIPGAEQAYEDGTRKLLELGGTASLIDEVGAVTHRLPIRYMNNGLETAPLDARLLKAMVDSTAIRIETPSIRMEAGTVFLPIVIAKLRQQGLTCGAVP